jgi:2-phosphoglycerate kinase
MFNVCPACGLSQGEFAYDPEGFHVCPDCGARRPRRRLSLLLVGGPAGAGKSTAGALLLGEVTEAVIIESDVLWRPEFNTPDDRYATYFSLWLTLAAHISQSGRPVALFGAGFAVPHNVEPLAERALFSVVHYLALVCDDEELERRLSRRPRWKEHADRARLVAEHVQFNHWLKEHAAAAAPPVTLLDTAGRPAEETAARVASWIREKVSGSAAGAIPC